MEEREEEEEEEGQPPRENGREMAILQSVTPLTCPHTTQAASKTPTHPDPTTQRNITSNE